MLRSPLPLAVAVSTLSLVACGASDRTSASADGAPGGGTPDASGLPFVCDPQSETNPHGLKSIQYLDSVDSVYPSANWRVALEPETAVAWATFEGAGARESAMLFDLSRAELGVAGFLVSRDAAGASALEELDLAQIAIRSLVPEVAQVTTRVSGSNIQSLDGFDTVVRTEFEVTTTSSLDATRLRETLVPALLAREPDAVSFPDPGWQTAPDTRFIVTLQTLYRAEAGQTLFMGAVARALDYEDRARTTGLHADDLSNGSGLTRSRNGEARECEDSIVDRMAVSDIVWVVDESGSMGDDRDRIAGNADTFFQMALDLGLDFRMGVTDMDNATHGKFATRMANDSGERWLLPDEPEAFAAAIRDPSGPGIGDGGDEHGLTQVKAVIDHHMPRGDAGGTGVRTDAKLAVIIVTDEKPDEVEVDIMTEGNEEPTPAQETQISDLVEPYRAQLAGEDAVVHLISEPLPFDDETCSNSGAEHAYGYYELVGALGGQMGSICQLDLGPTLDGILDSIVGDASPVVLAYIPISATITVMSDGIPVPRSRAIGWDYRASSNSIVFHGMGFDPANPAMITIGYRRWQDQVVE